MGSDRYYSLNIAELNIITEAKKQKIIQTQGEQQNKSDRPLPELTY